MGILAQTPPRQGVLPEIYQMDEQGKGSVQVGGFEGGVEAVGDAQEQARHELRDDGTRPEVLLPEGHPGEGGRSEAGLPIRGGPEGYNRNRLYGRVIALTLDYFQ